MAGCWSYLDPQRSVEFFGRTQGWTPDEVRAQVLTPIEESSLLGTPHADPRSIMCYQIPCAITKDGKPIAGGKGIDAKDYAFACSIYPKRTSSGPAPRRAARSRGAGRRRTARRAA